MIHSGDTLTEFGTIVFLTENRIGPGWMAQESEEARATHADRVTAACVANHARRFSGVVRATKPKAPPGSIQQQLEEEEAESEAAEQEAW